MAAPSGGNSASGMAFHRLPWGDIDAFAHLQGDQSMVLRLRRAEHSRRKLLLYALLEDAAKVPEHVGPLPSIEAVWDLLARVEEASPVAFDRLLAHPYTGAWAGYTTRLLRNGLDGVGPLWIHVGHVHAIAAAAKAEPSLNAWYNAQAGERRLIARIDIGIAVDLEGGLLVPVLRNVGERDAKDLRAGLDRMRADAAARSIPPEELRGATITLSNFGMIGGLFANLVVVPPQVAIVGAGRVAPRVVAHAGQPAVRRVLPLSLTFDHRVVTGGEAARFLMALKSDLERPS